MKHVNTELAQINHENAIAYYFGIEVKELKQSQVTGQLFGVNAPAHFKIGKVSFYKKSVIERWLAQFVEQEGCGL